MAKLFVCYSRKDSVAARRLIEAFNSIDHDVWVDWESIPPAVDWLEQIFRGIEECDAFIFLISPDSVASEVCNVEIGRAAQINKRIIPIVLRDVDPKITHENIRKLNWTFVREVDNFEDGLAKIKTAIELDLDWLEEHRRLLVRSLEWHRKKDVSLLLRGRDLRNARHMIATATSKDVIPTDLQKTFIQHSLRSERNRVIAWLATGFAILVMAILSYTAITQSNQLPTLRSQLADAHTQLAIAHTQLAQTSIPPNTSIVAIEPVVNTPVGTESLSPTHSIASPTQTLSPNLISQAIEDNKSDTVYEIILGTVSIVGAYCIGLLALVVRASQVGSTLFSRSWLTKLATKPLIVTPGLGKWVLFIGYKRRLTETLKIYRIHDYFGVPAEDPSGRKIIPIDKGEALHDEIIKALGPQRPVFITGNGGAGKTTLLARLTYLTLHDQISDVLKGYYPVFVTPAYFEGDLLSAISDVLRERDGIALDKDTLQSQLEVGKYLILFDGISEIKGDQVKGLEEIVKVAQNAEFKNCRFAITSRPNISIPSELPLFKLQSLTLELIEELLTRYNLERERKEHVLRQLEIFKSKSIEPLLFSMILQQSEERKFSFTLSELYESYARKLLRIDSYTSSLKRDNDTEWNCWNFIMEQFARWFFIETGSRGIGLKHRQLIDFIEKDKILSDAAKYYKKKFEREVDIILELKWAGILEESRRWRFAHDTLEEYFAAKYIVSHLEMNKALPDLGQWRRDAPQEQSFSKVIEFIAEMVAQDFSARDILLNSDLPSAWVSILEG